MRKAIEEAVMAQVRSFPAMPDTMVRLLKLLNAPDTDAAMIEQTVRFDAGLTANILRLANSVYFGSPGKIGSVRQAIVRLGWRHLSQLVLASSMQPVLAKAIAGYDLAPGALWQHCAGVALATEALAAELGLPSGPESFTAGLLHDVGKLVLGQFVNTDLQRIDMATSSGQSYELAELEVLGTDHAEVGALILENWKVPPEIVQAVRWHHSPDRLPPPSTLVDLIHVSDVLCLSIGMGIGHEGLAYQPSKDAHRRLQVKSLQLERVGIRVLQALQDLMESMDAAPVCTTN